LDLSIKKTEKDAAKKSEKANQTVEKEQHTLEEHHTEKVKLEKEESDLTARAAEHQKITEKITHEVNSAKKLVDETRSITAADHLRKLTSWRAFSDEKAQAREKKKEEEEQKKSCRRR